MIKKSLAIATLLLTLSACVDNQLTYAQASYLCENHAGISNLIITGAKCKDGTSFPISIIRETTIPVEKVRQYYSEQAKPLN